MIYYIRIFKRKYIIFMHGGGWVQAVVTRCEKPHKDAMMSWLFRQRTSQNAKSTHNNTLLSNNPKQIIKWLANNLEFIMFLLLKELGRKVANHCWSKVMISSVKARNLSVCCSAAYRCVLTQCQDGKPSVMTLERVQSQFQNIWGLPRRERVSMR